MKKEGLLKRDAMLRMITYIAVVATALTLGACMAGEDDALDRLFSDDWDEPDLDETPYGNNDLEETNVITIAELKSMYFGSSWSAYDTIRITDDVQIKGRVTANDIEGNIYNEICLEDETGGVIICVSQGGLFGYMPVGQQLLVSLQGLYIGHYGSQPQIGTPYTNSSGRTFPSRMARTIWQEKFKILGSADASLVQPKVFDLDSIANEDYVKANCGRLMIVKGVSMANADGTTPWASEDDKDSGNGVSQNIRYNGKSSSSFVVRSSTYADFAADPMPTGTINITGLFTVYASNPSSYGYTWQILLRQSSDVEEVE